jgi:hypothetical protein
MINKGNNKIVIKRPVIGMLFKSPPELEALLNISDGEVSVRPSVHMS